MKYEIIENGQVVNTIEADEAFMLSQFPNGNYNEIQETPVTPTPEVVKRHITKLAFRNRFTSTEKITIEIACLDDPTAPMAQRQLAAALRSSQADINAASYIDLDRQDTRDGVIALEAAGLLAANRALTILDAAIQPEEIYKG